MTTLNLSVVISFYTPYLIETFSMREERWHIFLWNVLVTELSWGYCCGLLNIAMHRSVLSCNEQHKHLHFNVHYGSQLKISRVYLKTISFLHYNLFGNTSVTAVITLQGLRVDNHRDLITDNDKLLGATQHGTEEGQEMSDVRIRCADGRKGRILMWGLIFLFNFGKICLLYASTN